MSFLLAFFHEEYLIASVDFIVALRRTKGRRRWTLRSPSPPSSGLHLLTPENPLRRGTLAAAVDRDIVSLCPVQVAYPHFDISFGGIVFGLRSLAFQSVLFGLYRTFFIIGWKKDAVCLALSHVFLITADRDYCFTFVGCKSISPNIPGRRIS